MAARVAFCLSLGAIARRDALPPSSSLSSSLPDTPPPSMLAAVLAFAAARFSRRRCLLVGGGTGADCIALAGVPVGEQGAAASTAAP